MYKNLENSFFRGFLLTEYFTGICQMIRVICVFLNVLLLKLFKNLDFILTLFL